MEHAVIPGRGIRRRTPAIGLRARGSCHRGFAG
jgi:hypothetical protein